MKDWVYYNLTFVIWTGIQFSEQCSFPPNRYHTIYQQHTANLCWMKDTTSSGLSVCTKQFKLLGKRQKPQEDYTVRFFNHSFHSTSLQHNTVLTSADLWAPHELHETAVFVAIYLYICNIYLHVVNMQCSCIYTIYNCILNVS